MSTLPCSITEFARLVGRDPNTVSNWLKASMPVVGTSNKTSKPLLINLKGSNGCTPVSGISKALVRHSYAC
jgi:hypothetical protein